jgi:hypothetical protein
MKWIVVSCVKTNSTSLIDSSIAINVEFRCVMIVQSILLGYLTMDIIKECELAEIASSRFTFQEWTSMIFKYKVKQMISICLLETKVSSKNQKIHFCLGCSCRLVNQVENLRRTQMVTLKLSTIRTNRPSFMTLTFKK